MLKDRIINADELRELLVKNKVADAYQYYFNCIQIITELEYHYSVLKKIVLSYEDILTNIYQDIPLEWEYGQVAEYRKRELEKNFIMNINGERVDELKEIQGRFMLIVGLTHSLLDSYAKWINTSLLAEKKIDNEKCHIYELCNRIDELGAEMNFCRVFLQNNVKPIITKEEYFYITSLNNLIKHQKIIKVMPYRTSDGTWHIGIDKFKKKEHIHNYKNLLPMLEKCIQYFCETVYRSAEYISKYYSTEKNPFTNYRTHEIGYYEELKDLEPVKSYFYIPESEVNKKGNTYILLEKEGFLISNCFLKEVMVTKDDDPGKIVGKLVPEKNNDIRLHYKEVMQGTVEILDMNMNDFDIGYKPYVWCDDTSINSEALDGVPIGFKNNVYRKL